MLIHLCTHLIVGQVVDYSYLLSGRDALSEFHVEESHLAIGLSLHLKSFLALAYEQDILLHCREVVSHLVNLRLSQLCVLLQFLLHERQFLRREFIIFLRLQIFLTAHESLLIEFLLMLPCTTLGDDILCKLSLLTLVGEFVLFHSDMSIAEHILLFGKFTFRLKYLEVEIGVGEAHQHVALLHRCSLLHNTFTHYAALFGRHLHHLYRHHLSIHRHIVVKLLSLHLADAQSTTLHLQCRGKITSGEPHKHSHNHGATANPRPVFLRHHILLLFNLYVHISIFIILY